MGQCPSRCLAPNPESDGRCWWIGEHPVFATSTATATATATANDRTLSAPVFHRHRWAVTEQWQWQWQWQWQRERRDRIPPQHLVPGTTDARPSRVRQKSRTDIDTTRNTTASALTTTTTNDDDDDDARWNKVLLQIPREHRERLVDACRGSLPPSMDPADGLALVSVLATVGLLSLLGEMVDISKHSRCTAPGWSYGLSHSGGSGGSHTNHSNTNCNTNTNADTDKHRSPGRIERLSLGGSRYYFDGDRDEDPFDLPPGIAHLDRLRELIVVNCRSLPKSLRALPVLEKLMWIRCDLGNGNRNGAIRANTNDTPGNDDVEPEHHRLELRSVATIAIVECSSVGSRDWFAWMATSLPNLRCLQCGCLRVRETDALLRALRLASSEGGGRERFREGLRALVLDACQLTDGHLERLLLEVLPGFPNVTHLRLSRNQIRSWKGVASELEATRSAIPQQQTRTRTRSRAVSLREISLPDNPCLDRLRDDPSETAALATVLKALDTIGRLGGARSIGEFGPDVEYALRINRAGKRLLEPNDRDDDDDRARVFPLSAWPLLLERAVDATATETATATQTATASLGVDVRRSEASHWKDERANATGVYYLLRNAPFVLLGTRP